METGREYKKIVNEILELHKEEKLFLSYRKIQDLKKCIENDESVTYDDFPKDRFQIIEREYEEIQMVIKELYETEKNWELASHTKSGIKTYMKLSKNESLNLRPHCKKDEKDNGYLISSFRIEGDVEAPIFNILSIFYEIDLYPHWVMSMSNARIIEKYSKYRFLCYYSYSIPFPFYDRDIVCYGYGVDNLEDEGIIVIVRSVNKDEYPKFSKNVPEQNESKFVRMDCNYAAFLVKPLSPNRTHVKVMCSVHPKLSFIPNWIINTVCKVAAPYMMNHVRDFAMNISKKPHSQRIKEKVEVYGDIENRVKKVFQKRKELENEEQDEEEEQEGEEEEDEGEIDT